VNTIIKLNHVTIQYIVNIFTVKMLSAHPENPCSTVCIFSISQKKSAYVDFPWEEEQKPPVHFASSCMNCLVTTMEVWHWGGQL